MIVKKATRSGWPIIDVIKVEYKGSGESILVLVMNVLCRARERKDFKTRRRLI